MGAYRRATVDDSTDGGAMRLPVGRNTEEGTKGRHVVWDDVNRQSSRTHRRHPLCGLYTCSQPDAICKSLPGRVQSVGTGLSGVTAPQPSAAGGKTVLVRAPRMLCAARSDGIGCMLGLYAEQSSRALGCLDRWELGNHWGFE